MTSETPSQAPNTTPPDQARWSDLMRAAQRGDSAAYRLLLTEITPAIQAFLHRRLIQKDQVEDVTQETLLALHKARHSYLPDQPFAHWMYGIARHKMIDFIRKQSRNKSHEADGDFIETFAEDQANNMDEAGYDLTKAINTLPEKQRDILILTKIKGYSMAEVAEKKGMSETAVKVAAHRGYQRLKIWLAKDGYE